MPIKQEVGPVDLFSATLAPFGRRSHCQTSRSTVLGPSSCHFDLMIFNLIAEITAQPSLGRAVLTMHIFPESSKSRSGAQWARRPLNSSSLGAVRMQMHHPSIFVNASFSLSRMVSKSSSTFEDVTVSDRIAVRVVSSSLLSLGRNEAQVWYGSSCSASRNTCTALFAAISEVTMQ